LEIFYHFFLDIKAIEAVREIAADTR